MKPKVLVTGGAGCIGIEVSKQLRDSGYVPIIYDLPEKILQVSNQKNFFDYVSGSILDKGLLFHSMKSVKYVIHLAALLGVERTENEPRRCLEINIEGTKNVIEACTANEVKNLIFASSSEVYGEPVEEKVNENSITQGKTVYAISKLAGEEYIKAICKENKKFKSIILRYFNTFGPFQTAQFAIPNFIKAVLNHNQPIVNGLGNQLRSYCYVSDTAKATISALNYKFDKNNFEIFNIGNPNNCISVLELAKKIIDISGNRKLTPKMDEKFLNTDRIKKREIFKRICNISKAKALLNFQPSTTLHEGLSNTISANKIWSEWPKTIIKN